MLRPRRGPENRLVEAATKAFRAPRRAFAPNVAMRGRQASSAAPAGQDQTRAAIDCRSDIAARRSGAAMHASACRSPAKVRRGCFTIAIDCRSDIAARRSGSAMNASACRSPLVHALATRQTRVATYMLTKCQGLTRFPWLGYTALRHHDYTHTKPYSAQGQRILRDICRW